MSRKLFGILISIFAVVVLVVTTTRFESAPARAQQAGESLNPGMMPLPPQGNPKLDWRLNQLVSTLSRSPQEIQAHAQEASIVLGGDYVRVIVESLPGKGQAALAAVSAAGVVESTYGDLVQAIVPVQSLAGLADSPSLKVVRTPFEFLEDAVTSEGLAVIGAGDWQVAGYNGVGVKIGVLDIGFFGYDTRQTEGELPAVTTWWSPSIAGPGAEKHGAGVAEIIYDVAPSAQIYLANFDTEVELNNAVDWLIAQGVSVISCSIGWPTGGPGDGTGPITTVVDRARNAGVLWVNAAGNSAQFHWEGAYSDPDGNGYHNFLGTDEGNNISVTGTPQNPQLIRIWMKWDDPWGASANDYALVLVDSASPQTPIVANNIQTGTADPTEYLSYTATNTGMYYISISKSPTAAPANLHIYSSAHALEHQVAAGSLLVPADSVNALTVGAVYWNTPTSAEPFSSHGPTKDGRPKPDLVAPDGVSTITYGTAAFYGTSASTPHTAAAAALVKQMYPTYAAAQLQTYLESSTFDLGTTGKDNLFGWGRLRLPSSVTTDAASLLAITSARLNGTLVSLWSATSANVSFEWGLTSSYGNTTASENMTGPGPFSANITGLSPNTIYHFRSRAIGIGITYGADRTLTTTFTPPTAATNTATQVQFTSATLNGNLADNGTAPSVAVSFEWGLIAGILSNSLAAGTMQGAGPFSANLTGLSAAGTYYYRAKAVGHGPAVFGNVMSFTTQSTPPSVTTTNATVAAYTAWLFGTLDQYGTASTANVHFQYRTGTGAWNDTPSQPYTGTGPLTFVFNLTGLSSNTTYSYRACANGHGLASGLEKTFTTIPPAAPAIATDNATNVSYSSANLNHHVISYGSATSGNVSFQWGLTPGQLTHELPAYTWNNGPGGGVGWGGGGVPLTGLSASTTYYYRAKAVGDGTGYGDPPLSFTTLPAAPPPPSGGGGSSGGGGGGGGGAPAGQGVKPLSSYTNDEGLFNLAATAKSDDGRVSISIAKGVRARTKEDTALKSIKIVPAESAPVAQGDWRVIGLAYEMTPDGATFSPSVGVNLFYDPAKLSQNTDVNTMALAVYNTSQSRWDLLESVHNRAEYSLTAQVGHFSIYAVVGKDAVATPPPPPAAPAKFAVSGVAVSAGRVPSGQAVTVSARVGNTGGSSGEFEVTLKINNAVETTKRVSVAAGASSTVTFTFIKITPGTYLIDIDGVTASFIVEEPPPLAAKAPAQLAAAPEAPPKQGAGSIANIGILAAAVVVVVAGGTFGFLWKRRRA